MPEQKPWDDPAAVGPAETPYPSLVRTPDLEEEGRSILDLLMSLFGGGDPFANINNDDIALDENGAPLPRGPRSGRPNPVNPDNPQAQAEDLEALRNRFGREVGGWSRTNE